MAVDAALIYFDYRLSGLSHVPVDFVSSRLDLLPESAPRCPVRQPRDTGAGLAGFYLDGGLLKSDRHSSSLLVLVYSEELAL